MRDEQQYREAERRLWPHVGLSPVEQRIQLAGVGVRVQIVGDGPPVVLVHGGPNAGSTWAPVPPYLAGYRCYVIDRPGTGLSDNFVLTDDVHGFARRFMDDVLRSVTAPTLFLWGEDDPGEPTA